MTTFDERERAYEAKFAHDADIRFRAEARCNRLLGEWAAGLLDKKDEESRDYAMSMVSADCSDQGRAKTFRRLSADLTGKADEATIRMKMTELMAEAQTQVMQDAN